jgi:uncharacterized protein YndB with AHSA1/START domain
MVAAVPSHDPSKARCREEVAVIKKIFLFVLLLIVVCVGAVLAMAMSKPNTYHVERKATIAASPETVFPMINNLHTWQEWSPWEHLDPNMKREFSGPDAGVGAAYAWSGIDKVGTGKMTITESQPNSHLAVRLDFEKPFQASDQVAFDLLPSGSGTEVTWSMGGNHNMMSKVMCVFTSMDAMIGPDFERGLGTLKTVAESAPPAAAMDSTATMKK